MDLTSVRARRRAFCIVDKVDDVCVLCIPSHVCAGEEPCKSLVFYAICHVQLLYSHDLCVNFVMHTGD